MRVLALLLVASLLSVACDNVEFVERLVIVNETDYPANVDARGDSGGWLDLARVSAGDTHEVREIIHLGSTWTFRFSYATYDPVDLTLTEEELTDAEWRVEVPLEFEESLRTEGVSPPP